MPELDRFEKSFSAGWRAAFNWIRKGIATDSEISGKLMKSLAQDLRKFGGIPGLFEMCEVVANALGVSRESFDALDRIARDNGGHRHTMVAAETGKFILASQMAPSTASSLSDIKQQFAIAVLEGIVEHKFFGNARQFLVEEGHLPNHGTAYDWQNRMKQLNQPAIEKIANQLEDNPSGDGLKAPRRTVTKESTSTLLRQGLLPPQEPRPTLTRLPL